jgi:hypothetical protein
MHWVDLGVHDLDVGGHCNMGFGLGAQWKGEISRAEGREVNARIDVIFVEVRDGCSLLRAQVA